MQPPTIRSPSSATRRLGGGAKRPEWGGGMPEKRMGSGVDRAESRDVCEILRSTGGELILDLGFFGQEGDGKIIKRAGDPGSPGLIPINAT